MNYVRSLGGSVSKTWNSINPATLSGAIDVIVVEQENGELHCSPFHVRFGKFSLLRPSEKKVEFRVNNAKQNFAMKLGEGGEAFFVFETTDDIPQALQTSPVVSPQQSPEGLPADMTPESLQEPEPLDLENGPGVPKRPRPTTVQSSNAAPGYATAQSFLSHGSAPEMADAPVGRPVSGDWSGAALSPRRVLERSASEEVLPMVARRQLAEYDEARKTAPPETYDEEPPGPAQPLPEAVGPPKIRLQPEDRGSSGNSPPPVAMPEAVHRALNLSKKLSVSNIRSHVTETGDLMLDMEGYKSSEEQALRAELLARKLLAEELKGNYDIGALFGADEHGNLWIYSSEEAKDAAFRRSGGSRANSNVDSASDGGYSSDGDVPAPEALQKATAAGSSWLMTPPQTPPDPQSAESGKSYAKTLRLTSNQLRQLDLKAGANLMTFTVNRATCTAYMFYWSHRVPVVISDIDGTITKSDALGHVLNMIGRDWTHLGVAKLYSDIASNGYNILYLTSRSVGQADSTRAYLHGINQEGFRLPPGPVILSPDRTIAALRREIYLRKPEVFKMACLRDVLNLFSPNRAPFYAGFGNRLTDALSYRSVNIPSNRIFTINSNAEVSLDLLTLTKYKSSYVTMRELIDMFFPPVGLLVASGGEEFTDFNYWRERTYSLEDFSASESDGEGGLGDGAPSLRSEDIGTDGLLEDDRIDDMLSSVMSNDSVNNGEPAAGSIMETIEADETRWPSSG